jgi:hypothetical protein
MDYTAKDSPVIHANPCNERKVDAKMNILTPTQLKTIEAEKTLIARLVNINKTKSRRAAEERAAAKRQAVIDGDAA